MKKKLHILLPLLLVMAAVFQLSAQETMPRLVDNANLLSPAEEETIRQQLDEISMRQDVDVVIVTEYDIGDKTPEEYADDFLDYNGYREDGILLLISMADRDWHVSTAGYGITAITDAGLAYIQGRFLPSLSAGDYEAAFACFAEMCDQFITQAQNGEAYDVDFLPKQPFMAVRNLIVSLIIGFLIALIATSSMKKKLTSVKFQQGAASYVRKDSMQLREKSDSFLYSNVSKRARPQQSSRSYGGGSSTHHSSSGRSHGGGGGKF